MALLTRSPDKARYSVEEFEEIASRPEYAEIRQELVRGEIIELPFRYFREGVILSNTAFLVHGHVMKHQLGRGLIGCGYVLERDPDVGDTVRGIDITYMSHARVPEPPRDTWPEIAPDLAIEIMSPFNTVSDTNLKIEQLLRMGCPQIWIVHPELRRVDVHSADGIKIYREDERLSAPDILPGFELAIADIFSR